MKLERGLQSTHNFKKSTYRMLRKLHCFESRGSIRDSQKIGNNYCIILLLKHMSDTIRGLYKDSGHTAAEVFNLCEQIDRLVLSIQKRNRVSRSMLVACLKKHTCVFNLLEANHIMIESANKQAQEEWTMKCIPAYICQFKNDV